MNEKSSEKMVRANIATLFDRRNIAIREKNIGDFSETYMENIYQPPLEKYFSYDEFNSKILAIEDPTSGHGIIRFVFTREWFQGVKAKNAGLPASFRHTIYGVAKTNLGWRIYEVVFPYEH